MTTVTAAPHRRIKSGKQQATELLLVTLALLIGVYLFFAVRARYLSPIRDYYRGMSQGDSAKMASAFPAWLRNAEPEEGTVSIEDMCRMTLAAARTTYGTDCTAKAEALSYTEPDEAYLQQLEEGIQVQYGKDVHISAGRWVTLTVTYRSAHRSWTTTEYARIYKINGAWVLLDIPSAEQ